MRVHWMSPLFCFNETDALPCRFSTVTLGFGFRMFRVLQNYLFYGMVAMNTILKIAQMAATGFPILVSEMLGFWVPIRPQ